MEASEEVLKEDPRTRENSYLWLYMAKVLRKMGFKIYIQFDSKMPSPDSMLTERRTILHKKNLFAKDFSPEEGVTYQTPGEKQKIEISPETKEVLGEARKDEFSEKEIDTIMRVGPKK